MRKTDMFQALMASLYTLNTEIPEEDRDPKLEEYLDKYMPNFGKKLPPKDDSVMLQFKKFADKRCKKELLTEDDGYDIVKKFIHERTDFAKLFDSMPKDDWSSLCDLINVANEINTVNAMKEAGTYEQMVKSGQGDRLDEYIKEHPDLMSQANPNIAMQSMGTMGASAGMTAGTGASGEIKKRPVHPNKKKKKKKRKK